MALDSGADILLAVYTGRPTTTLRSPIPAISRPLSTSTVNRVPLLAHAHEGKRPERSVVEVRAEGAHFEDRSRLGTSPDRISGNVPQT